MSTWTRFFCCIRPGVLLGPGLFFLLLSQAAAQGSGPHPCGVIEGVIRDDAGRALPLVQVELPELRQGGYTDARGEVRLLHVIAGSHRLVISHVGYHTEVREVEVAVGDTTRLELELHHEAVRLEDIHVHGDHRLESLHEPDLKRRSAEIQQELGLTLAETLQEEVGISSRTMGPAPARPVLRGLSGNRLVLLEDGAATGDLSATSSDHAVAIDPIGARSLELLRGPESMLLGSGSVAGVVNVERGLIAAQHKDKPSWVASLNGDSGTEGLGSALRLETPLRSLDLVLDATMRNTGNQRTPVETLDNSSLQSLGLGGGLALNRDHWSAGLALNHYRSDYGIPGGFVGGHPEGVDLEMRTSRLELQAQRRLAAGPVHHLQLQSRLARYYHAEYESSGRLGIDFGVLSAEHSLEFGLRPHLGFHQGRLRLEMKLRDFATGGISHAPDTDELFLAAGLLEHIQLKEWHASFALRMEHQRITPDEERNSVVVGHIRERSIQGAGLALQLDAPLAEAGPFRIQTSLEVIRGWRAPSVEELFSGGPHLAAYSYEIGNPELEAESSLGLELPVTFHWHGGELRLSAYATDFEGFIFPSFTGQFSSRRADLYEYRTVGRDARFRGLEWSQQQKLGRWEQESRLSLTRGDLKSGGHLPEIPPLQGLFSLARQMDAWRYGLSLVWADRQDRVYKAEDPAAVPEANTAGWVRLDAKVLWRYRAFGAYQQLQFEVENVFDREYRQHLSRIRSVMPEGGRSLRITWRSWW